MDVWAGFGLFFVGVVLCMVTGQSLTWALLAGFFYFFFTAVRRGNSPIAVLKMAATGAKTTLVVFRILLLIGCLTALWRASGTIAFFVYWGIEQSTPHTFILVAFLLPAILSLAFGSSFGVSGTAGVILLAIARSGGANELVTAGAALSGAYFGERLSPASSAAALNAAVAKTNQRDFQREMWRTTPLPLVITLVFYGVLSWFFPIQAVDRQIITALSTNFDLSWPMALPAVVLLILPWFKVSAIWSISSSCLLSIGLALVYQGMDVKEILLACVMGHQVSDPLLGHILSGGGLISMVTVITIVMLSTAYSGIFSGTNLLEPLKERLSRLSDKIGLFPAQCTLSLILAGLFCNQAVSIVLGAQMTHTIYEERERTPLELSTHMGNSVINLAGVVPWCIACSVPLANMGVSAAAVPLAIYLYAVPLCYMFRLPSKKK